ncbi:MAG: hypothetical protein ACREQB_06140 [Candidatus Binataceae bacterium]
MRFDTRPLIAAVAGALLLAACGSPEVPVAPAKDSDKSIHAWGIFGAGNVHIEGSRCKGRATLQNGAVTVNDDCFTGDTNIVVCTNVSSTAGVKCTPAKGQLRIEGTGGDTVAYALIE